MPTLTIDATRTDPDTLEAALDGYHAAITAGARRVVVCDGAGNRLISFTTGDSDMMTVHIDSPALDRATMHHIVAASKLTDLDAAEAYLRAGLDPREWWVCRCGGGLAVHTETGRPIKGARVAMIAGAR